MTAAGILPVGAVPAPERLPVWLKVTHGLGSIAYGVKDNGFSTFLLLFYNQVIDCCAWRFAAKSVLPITIAMLQRGSPAPDDHHLVPLMT